MFFGSLKDHCVRSLAWTLDYEELACLQEWSGNPAAFVRDLSKEELNHREAEAEDLADAAKEHAEQFLPVGNVYRNVSAVASLVFAVLSVCVVHACLRCELCGFYV